MRIAILADIHGNLPALEAVIAELEILQPDQVVLNGDLINGIPFSGPVIDAVRQRDWAVIRGNHEFYYLDFGTERAAPGCEDPQRWGQLHWLVEHLSPTQGAYLALLPDERTIYLPGLQPLVVAHGLPGRNRVGFHNDTPADRIAAELAGIPFPNVVSAHTHVQIDRLIHAPAPPDEALIPPSPATAKRGFWRLVNPGSVGMPLNGDPRAQFVILEDAPEQQAPGGWRATFHRVAYDRRPALAAYEESGMAAAGGAMTQLFYWQLATAEPEVIRFFRWAYEHGLDPDCAIDDAFDAYRLGAGRAAYVRERDPLSAAH